MSSSSQEKAGKPEKPEKQITVTVNTKYSVVFTDHKTTGAEIKATAIAQQVPNIQTNFLLFEKKGPTHQVQIGDNDPVTLHNGQQFQVLADDDNS
jgi:hypothetical protein